MRTVLLRFLPACLALGQLANGAPACGGHGDRNTMLVTTSWLADHLKDPNLVILGVGQDGDYEKGHIPGSLFVKYMDTHLMKSPAGLTVELPPMSELADTFGKLGVTNDSHVVLYMTNDWVSPTTRVFLTLDAMGLGDHTSILDGGLTAWTKEGRPVTTDVPSVKRGKLEPCAQNDVIVDLNYMKSNLHHPGVDIIDARIEAHHSGAEVPKNSRVGHIPGASSLPFEKLVDDNNKLKPAAELKAILDAAGVKPGDRVVSYCYIGQRATVIYFVARYLGYDARLYDGSWEEWNKHTELPTEVSATK
jgi:thiosulfate/3-mercaptopyruvate sulfurtransferase